MTFREMKIRQDPECPMCGEHPTIDELIDYEQFCLSLATQPHPNYTHLSDSFRSSTTLTLSTGNLALLIATLLPRWGLG